MTSNRIFHEPRAAKVALAPPRTSGLFMKFRNMGRDSIGIASPRRNLYTSQASGREKKLNISQAIPPAPSRVLSQLRSFTLLKENIARCILKFVGLKCHNAPVSTESFGEG